MELVLFYTFSGLAVLSSLFVILHPRPTRALLSLIITMFSLAILFLLLGAYFVAMAHLIVYAGAVLVLFLFVIMLQGIGAREIPLSGRFHKMYLFVAGFVAAAFLLITGSLFAGQVIPQALGMNGTVETIGKSLFQNYLLPFELTSALLLLGVFAAVALAKKDPS